MSNWASITSADFADGGWFGTPTPQDIHPAFRDSPTVLDVDGNLDDHNAQANNFLHSILQLAEMKIEGGGDKIPMPIFSAADEYAPRHQIRQQSQTGRKRSLKIPIRSIPTTAIIEEKVNTSLPRYNLFPTITELPIPKNATPKVKARRSSSVLGEHDLPISSPSTHPVETDDTYTVAIPHFPAPPMREPPQMPSSTDLECPAAITPQASFRVRRHSQDTVTSDRSVPALSHWSNDSSISSTTVRSPSKIPTLTRRPTTSTTTSNSTKTLSKISSFRFRNLVKSSPALIEAAKLGDYHETLRLLAPGGQAHPLDAADKEGHTALHWASRLGYTSIARALIARHADVEARTKAQDRTALYLSAQNGFSDIVAALLEAGAKVDAKSSMDGATPLHKAAHQGHEAVIQQLLDVGADPNQRDIEGMPALMWATQGKQIAAAHLLISRGANMEARIKLGANLEMSSKEGMTVLHRAIQTGNHSFARLFVQLGADANANSPNGMKPLHRAAAKGDSDMVALLIEHGADLEGRTEEGWTPLHMAARYGHGKICKTLVAAGAEEGWLTKKGATARDLARSGGFDDLF